MTIGNEEEIKQAAIAIEKIFSPPGHWPLTPKEVLSGIAVCENIILFCDYIKSDLFHLMSFRLRHFLVRLAEEKEKLKKENAGKKFKLGDIVTPIVNVQFTDGSGHFIGDRLIVRETSIQYYNANQEKYEVTGHIDN